MLYTMQYCRLQYFSGYIPLELAIDQRKILFAFSILKHTDVKLGEIFSCFDVDIVLLEKCGILFGDNTETLD